MDVDGTKRRISPPLRRSGRPDSLATRQRQGLRCAFQFAKPETFTNV